MVEPLFQLQDVTVTRGGRLVLDAVSLTLSAGDRLAVVGGNGAGKTTLLRTLIGLQVPKAGRVVAFGRERVKEADFREVRTKAAYLFQDPDDQLFCPTVLEDVAFGPLNLGLSQMEAAETARATLAKLELEHLADRITHRLSGGEKRLVSLAAVLAMGPEVLLLDEPTNALDEDHLARLSRILDGLSTSMVLVSHDREFLERHATGAVILKGGKVVPAEMHRHPHTHDHVHIHP